MKQFLLLIVLLFLFSCKGRYYKARSGSMEETIKIGERFFVVAAGKFERNDIVVFNHFGPDYTSPGGEPGTYNMTWEKRVYRLIAYSGDSLEIKDGEVFVNAKHIPLPPKGKMQYEVLSKVTINELTEKYYAMAAPNRGDTLVYMVPLTTDQAFDYEQKKPAIISVKRKLSDQLPEDSVYARASAAGHWSSDNYGPLKIPSPGETITVDPVNFKFFQNIPGIKTGNNLVKEKLYFLLGDNRYGAEDSRFIGLVSHSKMYGVVK